MRCMLLLFSKVLSFFLGLTINDSSVVGRSPRHGPGPCGTCHCMDTEENPMSPCLRETTAPPAPAHRAHPRTEKQVIRIVADFSLGRLSHPWFYFTRIGLLADSSEDGCVLLRGTPSRSLYMFLLRLQSQREAACARWGESCPGRSQLLATPVPLLGEARSDLHQQSTDL